MKSADIRSSFLKFFEGQGHKIVASDSLIPSTDPTLLFTSAGMVQFKPNFQNPTASPYKRATSCQKCLRTSDIERVGTTLRHLTFFEMLGNFSFGDYFKKESIAWGWEFLTQSMKLPREKLIISVFKEDDEAADIWKKVAPGNQVVRLGEDSNFWTMGPTGPCGPCSEILYDRGASWGKEGDFDCDRYLEIWNHVFTQFDRQADGKLVPLPSKNIDTGMGLERLTLLAQGVESPFETDSFQALFKDISNISGRKPGDAEQVAFRRIADHSRAITFMISDGILPSNEGRGYVLRRLLRQAVRAGKTLGIQDPFLHKMSGTVIDLMKAAYPETLQRREVVASVVKGEEEKFLETLDSGTRRIEEIMSSAKTKKQMTLSGADVFQLYDTFGFPLELTKELVEPQGFKIDDEGFKKAQAAAVETARQGSWKGSGAQNVDLYRAWKTKTGISTVFRGYETQDLDSTIVGPFYKKTPKGWEPVDMLSAGDEAEVVCAETPFFSERGGQVGDTGVIESADAQADVLDTQAPVMDFTVHRVLVKKGTLKAGAKVRLKVDIARREAIMRHHTATHLLHQALRDLFGTQLTQAGSLVAPDRLRFDFTHSAPLTREERQKLEDVINDKVMNDIPVRACLMSKDNALKIGALMLFGEKYGDKVRAVMISPHDCSRAQEAWSLELCGGTHVPTTGHVGFFKIVSQAAVSAGVRRVEALAGPAAMQAVRRMEQQVSSLAETLKTTPEDLSARLEKVLAQEKQLEREIQTLKSKEMRSQFDDIAKSAMSVGGIPVVSWRMTRADDKQLRDVSDRLRDGSGIGVVVLAAVNEEKVSFVVSVQKTLTERGIHAGHLAKSLAGLIEGSGGGRPDFAQGGGKNVSALDAALKKVEGFVKDQLKK